MNILQQDAQIVFQPNPLLKVERAGRTCYQSKQSGSYESAADFAKRAMQNGHCSIFEHINFVFVFKKNLGSYYHYLKLLETAPTTPNFSATVNEKDGRNIISINFRFLIEAYRCEPLLANLVCLIYDRFPELFLTPMTAEECGHDLTDVECLTAEEFQMMYETQLSYAEVLNHLYFSFVLQTDRGVMAEITRHRLNAFSVSSTRYINFNKKYGGMPVIEPVTRFNDQMIVVLHKIDDTYRDLVNNGMSPQEARAILPNCLWTEIFTTANVRQWIHVFELRLSKSAHPQIRALMEKVRDLINLHLVNYNIDLKTMGLVPDAV